MGLCAHVALLLRANLRLGVVGSCCGLVSYLSVSRAMATGNMKELLAFEVLGVVSASCPQLRLLNLSKFPTTQVQSFARALLSPYSKFAERVGNDHFEGLLEIPYSHHAETLSAGLEDVSGKAVEGEKRTVIA